MNAQHAPIKHFLAVRRTYSAAHTLRSAKLSDEENLRVFGKCAHLHGHGHDYRLEFIVSSSTLTNDVVMPRGELLDRIDRYVTPCFDGVDLNKAFGDDMITSGENLARAAWERLAPYLPSRVKLVVRLEETRKNSFCYPATS